MKRACLLLFLCVVAAMPSVAKTINISMGLNKTITLYPYNDGNIKPESYHWTLSDNHAFDIQSRIESSTNDKWGKVCRLRSYTLTSLKKGTFTFTVTMYNSGGVGGGETTVNVKYVITVDNSVKVTQIVITPASCTMRVGEDYQMSLEITPSNATNKTINWTSSDVNVATVNSAGLVHATGTGLVDIMAATADGSNLKVTSHVTVQPAMATGITLNTEKDTLEVGETRQLIATITPEIASQQVQWTSSNNDVAIVDENGFVAAMGTGDAAVTATTTDGTNLSVSCLITVVVPGYGNCDVDGNGTVNGSDVTALYNVLLNGVQSAGDADVDGNGVVNGSDVTALYNLLLAQ